MIFVLIIFDMNKNTGLILYHHLLNTANAAADFYHCFTVNVF